MNSAEEVAYNFLYFWRDDYIPDTALESLLNAFADSRIEEAAKIIDDQCGHGCDDKHTATGPYGNPSIKIRALKSGEKK